MTVNGNTASYDAENWIKALSATVGGGAETLSYDGLGRRAQKAISGGATITYVYDAFGSAAEYVGGSWAKDYVKEGGGQLIATENASGPCTTCCFTTDHLGSGRALIDQNANVVTRHDYLPYGEEIATSTAGRDAMATWPLVIIYLLPIQANAMLYGSQSSTRPTPTSSRRRI